MNKETQKNLLDIAKKNYEEIAEDFNKTRKKYLWPELLKLADAVKNGDSVFDAGCGNGRLLEAFKDKKISYVGVDSSEKLIKLAREKYQFLNYELRIKNYEFLIGDILNIKNVSDKNFDYIFCIAVLHHVPGEDLRLKALENLKEKLADNGKIILTVWNLWSQKKFRKFIFKFAFLKLIGKNKMDFGDILFSGFNQMSQRYYHAFRMNELRKIIKKADLNIEKIYKDKYNYYVIASRAPLSRSIAGGHTRIK